MTDTEYMQIALDEAQKAYHEGEIPIGAVLVYKDIILAADHNRCEATFDPTSHAEVNVIRAASHFLSKWRLTDTRLYVTIEPCPMCAGAIMNARIPHLIYGAANPLYGGIDSCFHIGEGMANHTLDITSGILKRSVRHSWTISLSIAGSNFIMEQYRSGHNEADSKSVSLSRPVGSNPTCSAKQKALCLFRQRAFCLE